MHHLTKRWLKGYSDMNPDTAQDSSFNMKFLCIILRKKDVMLTKLTQYHLLSYLLTYK